MTQDEVEHVIRDHGIDHELHRWDEYLASEQKVLRPKLAAFAASLANTFLNDQIDYWLADSAINRVVVQLGHECCPIDVFEVYLAFEDAETEDDPLPKAKARLQECLARRGT